jgi:cytochrome c oxidase subunit IV
MSAQATWLRPCTLILVVLLALTGLNYALGKTNLGGTTIMLSVLAAAAVKVQLIVDHFMGLRHAKLVWRLIMLGWLLLVTGLICVAYLTSVK